MPRPGWQTKRFINRLTTTVPLPNVPVHMPPEKETHVLSPEGVKPTEMRGFSLTTIRKSCFNVGTGRCREGCGMPGKGPPVCFLETERALGHD